MSVIAWDGKSIATDRQMSVGDMRSQVTKLKRLTSGAIVGIAGSLDGGLTLMQWFENGAAPDKWPEFQKDKDRWALLVAVLANGKVGFYEQEPVWIPVEDEFMAWGSGRGFAMGAMSMGATARQAVEIACRFNVHCGMGIDGMTISLSETAT